MLDSLLHDLRYAVRTLCKNPGFAAVAVITLALAIGANTAIFSVIDSLILRPLPYAESQQLATVTGYVNLSSNVMLTVGFSGDLWKQLRDQTPAIERIAFYAHEDLTLSGVSDPVSIGGSQVSGDFFPLLGVKPILGRPILASDTTPGAERVAVLNYKLWREWFGGDRTIVGKTIALDEHPYRVIGVMPRDVDFQAEGRAVWTPLVMETETPADQNSNSSYAIVRFRRGQSLAALNEQLKTISARIVPLLPRLAKRAVLIGIPLRSNLQSDLQRSVLILLGAVGFVLLIACVNVSNLLLARGWSRQKEMAIRSALGASRGRLVRQFAAEGAVLALAGGLGALAVGAWTVRILHLATPPEFLSNADVRIDIRVLIFTLAISLLAGMLFAIAPAWQISVVDPRGAMSQAVGSEGVAAFSNRPRRLRSSLVIFEVSLAMVLVFGAALLLRSFEKLMARETGLQTDHVLAVSPALNGSVCDVKSQAKGTMFRCDAAADGILDRLRQIPGVEIAAAASAIPLEPGPMILSLKIQGRSGEIGTEYGDPIAVRLVSADYFRLTGIQLLQGRDFNGADTPESQNVAIVNDTFARKFFPNGALGQRFGRSDDKVSWNEIVGVVAGSHDSEIGYQEIAEYYVPLSQGQFHQAPSFILRTQMDPMALAPAVRAQIWAVDKNAPVELKTLGDVMREQEAEPHFRAILLTSFASLGLLLAMIGLYGVISYGVSQRTHEIGVRSALGAKPSDLLRMILREAMTLVALGIAIGIAGGLMLSRVLQSMLYEVKAGDPTTFFIVGVALALVALAACYFPARRAMRIDPMVALRHD